MAFLIVLGDLWKSLYTKTVEVVLKSLISIF